MALVVLLLAKARGKVFLSPGDLPKSEWVKFPSEVIKVSFVHHKKLHVSIFFHEYLVHSMTGYCFELSFGVAMTLVSYCKDLM